MTKAFYEWADANDPHATGRPDLGVYPQFRLYSKAAVRKDWRDYVATLGAVTWTPKLRVWRIAYEEVTV